MTLGNKVRLTAFWIVFAEIYSESDNLGFVIEELLHLFVHDVFERVCKFEMCSREDDVFSIVFHRALRFLVLLFISQLLPRAFSRGGPTCLEVSSKGRG